MSRIESNATQVAQKSAEKKRRMLLGGAVGTIYFIGSGIAEKAGIDHIVYLVGAVVLAVAVEVILRHRRKKAASYAE